MATSSKKRARHGVRYQLQLTFDSDIEKMEFISRFESVRHLFSSRRLLDNRDLLHKLLDKAKEDPPNSQVSNPTGSRGVHQDQPREKSMLDSCGVFNDESNPQESLFVCESSAFTTLCESLTQSCCCGNIKWEKLQSVQKGHTLRVEFQCGMCRAKRWWASSRIVGNRYLVNQKLIHAFTCAGILPSQYIHFSQFANIGKVGKCYIGSMYNSRGYVDVVNECAKLSMANAAEDVKALPNYPLTGEWVITDARHDSTANAYNTTVPCLSGSTKRILGISTVSRIEHQTAQTRELICTKKVLPSVLGLGLNVVEVAHDFQTQVKKYITEELKLLNSFDTWHGTKNFTKAMRKIAQGKFSDEGITWFGELSDKQ